jgi:hypothetical protein
MKTKVLTICLILILTIACVELIASAQGAVGEGDWFTDYTVENAGTGELMVEVNFASDVNRTVAPIFGSSDLAVTFTVSIPASSPNTLLKLKTAMIHSDTQDVYWKLVTQDYQLNTNYNPNSLEVTFFQAKGNLTMTLYGKVPPNVAKDIPVSYIVVTLYSPAGETLDQIRVTVVSAETSNYQQLLAEKQETLKSFKDSGADAGFVELYENVLNESVVQANLGNVESAIGMLNSLDTRSAPSSGTLEGLFLPVVGVLIALVAVFGVMFLRGRGKLQYVTMVLEDQIRDLEGLTLRAQRVDRTISTSLESVKDRLKNIVGM